MVDMHTILEMLIYARASRILATSYIIIWSEITSAMQNVSNNFDFQLQDQTDRQTVRQTHTDSPTECISYCNGHF